MGRRHPARMAAVPAVKRLPSRDWVHGHLRGKSIASAGVKSAAERKRSGPPAPSNGPMTSILADLRLAVRGLRRSPLFATVAILSLALGIGANTAIFTLIDQILLRKLPVAAPEQLVMLYQQRQPQRQQHGHRGCTRIRSTRISSRRREPLAEVLCRRLVPASVSVDNQTERVEAEMVSGNYFTMLGREAGARPRVQLAGGRPGLSGPSGRRAQLRLLGQPLRARSRRRRQEDPA